MDRQEIASEEGVAVVERRREERVFAEGALTLSPLPVSREQKGAGVSPERDASNSSFSAKQTAVLSRTRKSRTQGERGSREKQNPDAEGILI